MLLDYMDDLSAIRHLTSCSLLHGCYHQYPVKRAMSVATLTQLTAVDEYYRYKRHTLWLHSYGNMLSGGNNLILFLYSSLGAVIVVCLIVHVVLLLIAVYVTARQALAHRAHCCTRGRRVRSLRGWYHMPRVQRLSEELTDIRLLRYLQHLTELDIRGWRLCPVGDKKHPLPHSLRALQLKQSFSLLLTPDTLPPHLTSLSLSAIENETLSAGLLPQSLTSLHLTDLFAIALKFDVDALPPNLLKLEVDEWSLSLSILSLPASLLELHIHHCSSYPLPVCLPPRLEVLRIGDAFRQPSLTGVLPSSLRILRLAGYYSPPLTIDVFLSTPQLEELYLNDSTYDRGFSRLAASELPRSLRVLQLGKRYSLSIQQPSDLPPQLTRLILPAARCTAQLVARLQQIAQERASSFVIEQQSE